MDASKTYSPDEYFQFIKDRKHSVTDEDLTAIYDNCLELLNKYRITGQTKRELIALGVDTFIYRDDIEEYIDNVAKDVVKIIELENYEREIPDEIVSVVEAVKDKFDKLYVLFTDYTGRVERQVEKERRSTDPILFGTFQNEASRTVVDRFYFLGDWEDEYCDLTLDKLVGDFKTHSGRNITHTIKTPEDIAELKAQLNGIVENQRGEFRITSVEKKSFFNKIRSIFSGKRK